MALLDDDPAADLSAHLPLPPSVNAYWRSVKGRVLISKKGREYRGAVAARLAGVRGPLLGPLRVEVWVYPPDRRRRDLDNVLKSLLDALAHGGAYLDDSQIDDLRVRRGPVWPAGGGVLVRIWKAEAGHDAGGDVPGWMRGPSPLPEGQWDQP